MDFNFETINKFETRLTAKKAEYIGRGRHRISFRRGNFVYKLPRGCCGVDANRREHNFFKKHRKSRLPDGTLLARCRLLKNDVLVMEYLDAPNFDLQGAEVPPWARGWDWNSAGAQIGIDRKGTLRIFDYAE